MHNYNKENVIEVLPGIHTDEKSAYVVEDYPYGFTLRCKIRYWIESHPKKGMRVWTQTTNPKKSGNGFDFWNKAKASTYSPFMVMFLDENGHVKFADFTFYGDEEEYRAWMELFETGLPESANVTKEYAERVFAKRNKRKVSHAIICA